MAESQTAAEPAESSSSAGWFTVPSWLLSLVFHAVLLFFIATNVGDIGGGDPGDPDGDYSEVGIVMSDPVEATELNEETQETEQSDQVPTTTVNTDQSFQKPSDTEQPPVEITTPILNNPAIGPGSAAAPPVSIDSPLSDVVHPSEIRTPSASAEVGDRSTEFFGVRDKGESFVYVLDCSSSMNYRVSASSPTIIQFAKSELSASLRNLKSKQRFSVIFYNNKAPQSLSIEGSRSGELYWASSINLTLADRFIRERRPQFGTDHMPALRRAMNLRPDVIFFLTDADIPRLEAADLAELQMMNRKLNRGKTRIHAIEFGRYGEPVVDNFLKKLARQHNGTYRYRDITKLERR